MPGKHRPDRIVFLLVSVMLAAAAAAQTPALPPIGDADSGAIASTARFTFRSEFWSSLHDFLYYRAVEEGAQAEPPTLAKLPDDQLRAWREAEAFYSENLKDRDHLLNQLMMRLRYHLAGFDLGDEDEGLNDVETPLFEQTLRHLRAAAPAYRAVWWAEHDARNHKQFATFEPLVRKHEEALSKRLAREYQSPWPDQRIQVDLVTYVSWAGADTMVRPNHIMIGVGVKDLSELALFEVVFHEASHTMFGGRTGKVMECITNASNAAQIDPPRNLWHAILFYSTGEAIRETLAADGHEGYVPYVYAQGLFTRAWGSYQKPIEQHWRRYLDGKIDMQAAMNEIVKAIAEKLRDAVDDKTPARLDPVAIEAGPEPTCHE